MADVIPVLGLLASIGGTVANGINSADANSKANQIAETQQQDEKTLLNQATNQQNQQEQAQKNAAQQAAQLAARRALAGNNSGYNSTILAPANVTPASNPGMMVAGKTLLG